jgi:hypothetical protein
MSALSDFHSLALAPMPGTPRLPSPSQPSTLTDAAFSQLTDLRHAPCVTADHLDGVGPTLHVMLRAHVRMAFVTGVGGELLGLVTSDDLQGERPMQRAMADHVRHEDLTLEQLMTPIAQWQVVDTREAEHARVGHIVATMRTHGLRYLLVVDHPAGDAVLRGLFSARRLEMALGIDLGTDLQSRSFAALEAALVTP